MERILTNQTLVAIEQESDGRWVAEVLDPIVLVAYGKTPGSAVNQVFLLLKKIEDTEDTLEPN
jgi:hypothetical protein